MNFINIYINIIKNKKNYNIIFFNFKYNFSISFFISNNYLYNLILKLLS